MLAEAHLSLLRLFSLTTQPKSSRLLFMTFHRTLIVLLFVFGSTASAQDNCNLKIGTNLAGPSDYGSEWPFVDIFKYSRSWNTHNNPTWEGWWPDNPWDTGWHDSIPMDDQGYPLQVPFDVIGADSSQIVRTVWANTSQLPSGVYVLLYDGEGTFDFYFDGEIIDESPGRIEVQVNGGPNATGNILGMDIRSSTLGNHVRNIRFLMPGTEFTYEAQPWSQEWLYKLEPFNSYRFMDWGHTNNSSLRNWADRPHVDDATYTPDGVPYEWMIEISNMRNADAWVCIPHMASDDYVTQMATMFRDNLEPERKLYVEYSNEVWNWIFDQAHYGNDSLDQVLPWPERLAPRIGHVMQIWHDVFGTESDRIVCVLATQHGWFDIGNRIYLQMESDGNDHLIDAISPAAYMGIDHPPLATLGANATAEDVIMNAQEFTFDTAEYAMQGWYAHAELAAENNKQLIYYEGGQHFTPDPWGTVQPYNPALMAAQEDPLMYDLYTELFDTLSAMTDDETVLMHFSFISPLWEDPNDGAYGNFGSLASQFYQSDPYTDAPKYRALRDHINNCSITTGTENIENPSGFNIFPNPVSDQIQVTSPNVHSGFQLAVTDVLGRTVYDQDLQSPETIKVSNFGPPGLYFLRFENPIDNQVEVHKLIVR